tara:strand:- start:716 stop:1720 length:1005 start_codon:yes stop_codon:yes gene_type:complete
LIPYLDSVTGWLLIIALLILGGLLSTIGDRLGSRVGKARLTVLNLRPRQTAVLITVLTGSLISTLSLGFMLLVSRQLRVGLFELDDLQSKLRTSRLALAPLKQQRKKLESRIQIGELELRQLEKKLLDLRRGDVVITSGQNLSTFTFKLQNPGQAKKVIENILQKANREAYRRVRPRENPNKQILMVPKNDIKKLEKVITKPGSWVVSIRSAANVLLGEKLVYAFPEVRSNKKLLRRDEIIAKTQVQANEIELDLISKRIKLLLASTLAEVKRRGSLTEGLQFNADSINKLGLLLKNRDQDIIQIESVSLRNSYTSDPVSILLRISKASNERFD